ncbi:MAG: RNase J family beta-CASP ribonuclease [Nanoarchaeota archaeon]|nr:RNase J family beta-CASP ribonuclease [Nanoarchaeota archaeon]
MIEICAVGGYNQIGKNMTAVKYKDEVVIFDMGLLLDKYIEATDQDEHDDKHLNPDELRIAGAIPNDEVIKDWKGKVKAIIPTHAHLDHVGAIVYLSNNYNAPILCTAFTKEVLTTIAKDERITLKNEIKVLNVNARFRISEKMEIEFINVTHSCPHTVMVALHTPEGIIMYTNDFKFDDHPTLGKKPNYARMKELGNEGVKALIVDSTRADNATKTPSESVARDMLRDVMLGVDSTNKTVIVTTFASHLARLKSIVAMGKKMNRKVLFLGRSLGKYATAGEKAGLINFSKDVEMATFGRQIEKKLKSIEKKLSKYLLVVTGHQGEPNSTLSKLVDGKIPFTFQNEDHVVFSCTVIPTDINIQNRIALEDKLRSKHVRIFKDIHVSGHASREDLRDLLTFVKAENIIPAHGDIPKKQAMASLAEEKGYVMGKTIHMLKEGDFLKL